RRAGRRLQFRRERLRDDRGPASVSRRQFAGAAGQAYYRETAVAAAAQPEDQRGFRRTRAAYAEQEERAEAERFSRGADGHALHAHLGRQSWLVKPAAPQGEVSQCRRNRDCRSRKRSRRWRSYSLASKPAARAR